MEIKITANHMLKVLYVLSWIIFIGLCIEAGGIITNSFVTLVFNPLAAQYFWNQIDLSSLFEFDVVHFFVLTLLMAIVAIMKCILFYLIIVVLHDKKLNLSQPFNKEVGRFIINVSYLSLGIGLFSWWGVTQSHWLKNQGILLPDLQKLQFGGADVWLFMGLVLLVIAQIFKKGIEIQEENELTV